MYGFIKPYPQHRPYGYLLVYAPFSHIQIRTRKSHPFEGLRLRVGPVLAMALPLALQIGICTLHGNKIGYRTRGVRSPSRVGRRLALATTLKLHLHMPRHPTRVSPPSVRPTPAPTAERQAILRLQHKKVAFAVRE